VVVLSGKWTMIHHQIDPFLSDIQQQLEKEFGWTTEMQATWLKQNLNALSQNAAKFLSDSVNALMAALVNLVIIPIYITLILIFRHKLVEFVITVSPDSFKSKMHEVIQDTVSVFSRFIRGMVVVYITVGVLNSIGLWIIGVENPIMYGMLSAIMTIIPYFGIIISALLPMMLSWIETGSLTQPIGIILVFTVVQYLEANLIFPYVVGRFVNLNTLAAIIAIFLGALFWGVSGMILFLPVFAVIRLAASHFEELKPLHHLLGNK
jgi:predicted PurR-regulated permease PerM